MDRLTLTGIATPDAKQLDLINKYRPSGTPELEASELKVVTCRASNNLLWKDRKAWTPGSLLKMAQTYPGKPQIFDHDSSSSDSCCGFVFDAALYQSTPDDECMGIYRDLNQQILNKYGFFEVILQVAIQAGSSVEEAIRYRRINGVSTGTLGLTDYICPLCECQIATDTCDHIPPTWYVMSLAKNGELTDKQMSRIVPFVYVDGVDTAFENSFVNAPNLEGCKIL